MALSLTACGPSLSAKHGSTRYLPYSADGLSFRYPSTWITQTYEHPPFTFSTPIVNLSNAKLHDPCTTTGSRSVCGLPLKVLPAGGILVMWSIEASPTASPIVSHPDTTLAGRPARVVTTQTSWCSGLRGTSTINAEIQSQPSDGEYYMTACLRGPVRQLSQQVTTMLNSVSLTSDI